MMLPHGDKGGPRPPRPPTSLLRRPVEGRRRRRRRYSRPCTRSSPGGRRLFVVRRLVVPPSPAPAFYSKVIAPVWCMSPAAAGPSTMQGSLPWEVAQGVPVHVAGPPLEQQQLRWPQRPSIESLSARLASGRLARPVELLPLFCRHHLVSMRPYVPEPSPFLCWRDKEGAVVGGTGPGPAGQLQRLLGLLHQAAPFLVVLPSLPPLELE